MHLGQVHALNVAVTNFGHRGEKVTQIMPTNTNTFNKFIVNLMHLLTCCDWLTDWLMACNMYAVRTYFWNWKERNLQVCNELGNRALKSDLKSTIRPHKKYSWLASSPADKKGPAQVCVFFYLKKNPTFIDQQALIYVVFLLTVVNCVNKLRNCMRKWRYESYFVIDKKISVLRKKIQFRT